MDTAIGVTILSFVLPAAQCDLEMDSTAKGWLTASPMLGEYSLKLLNFSEALTKKKNMFFIKQNFINNN